MILSYHGDGGFRLQQGSFSLLVDPPNERLKADVILRSTVATNYQSDSINEIYFPGEYEIEGVEISGIPVDRMEGGEVGTMFLIRWEDVSIAFLGGINESPSAELIEKLNEPDILVLPVGGGKVLSPEDARGIVKNLEPSIVIPSLYKTPEDFLKVMGQKAEPIDKFVFKKKDLFIGAAKVLVLKQS